MTLPHQQPRPIVPENITVHLGRPNEDAPNVTIPFVRYIKNVASSEIYPTWPREALISNILAQISFALNRVYTEHYRSQGYDFDITNSTEYDQSFVNEREIFANISEIVDEIFNNYIVKAAQVQPYFAQYCDGLELTCPGLMQWGTVGLANQNLDAYAILRRYYGDDIGIVTDAPVEAATESYPGIPLMVGTADEAVRTIQKELNRIGDNYPEIPKVPVGIGIFDGATRSAVMKFQEIFDLTPTGVVDKAVWYKIKRIYNAVTGVSELISRGITPAEVEEMFQRRYTLGDSDVLVSILQYSLNFISTLEKRVPPVDETGVYDQKTFDAVAAFQRVYGLPGEGILNRETWNLLQQVYIAFYNALPNPPLEFFPGYYITTGSAPEVVRQLQGLLSVIAQNDPTVPPVAITGIYDQETQAAVSAIQRQDNIPVSSYVGPLSWRAIATRYNRYTGQNIDTGR